jgi:hypothetical protein
MFESNWRRRRERGRGRGEEGFPYLHSLTYSFEILG